jgi:hypothetical protein
VKNEKKTSALKMETARFSETLASTNHTTRRFSPKEHRQNCHRRENLKSHRVKNGLHLLQKLGTPPPDVAGASVMKNGLHLL